MSKADKRSAVEKRLIEEFGEALVDYWKRLAREKKIRGRHRVDPWLEGCARNERNYHRRSFRSSKVRNPRVLGSRSIVQARRRK